MASPVKIPFRSYISIDKENKSAVYLQIAQQFIQAIQRGFIPIGTKIPGTRYLAKEINVHRNTIINAIHELENQGWVDTKPNIGSFILKKSSITKKRIQQTNRNTVNQYTKHTGFQFDKNIVLDTPIQTNNSILQLNDGLPDSRLFPIKQLSKIYTSRIKSKSFSAHQSDPNFKIQLCNYLNQTRGLHINPNNLLITRSVQLSTFVIAKTLLNKDDMVIVGQPSFYASNMIFQHAGAQIKSIPVDQEGIQVEELEKLCKQNKVRLLYLTPQHHYPTTVTLSAERRIAVLELANQYGFAIIEDDYDYDFNYNNAPILPLASIDHNGMVVYIGALDKSLSLGFKMSFVVAAEDLIDELSKLLQILDHQSDFMMEQVLGEFIEEGELHRYIKKSTKIYKERRNQMSYLLARDLHEYIDFEIPDGGLALWTNWDKGVNLSKLSNYCAKEGLYIPKTLLYQSKNISAIRIGFANLNFLEMEKSVDMIKKSIQLLKK